MKTYKEIVAAYEKKKKNNLIDKITTGLTYADEVCIELGALSESGLLRELAGGALSALPFAMIAITEQMQVVLGKKTQSRGIKDAGGRMLKTGAAVGVSLAAAGLVGPVGALPVSIGAHMLMEKYKSRAFLGKRVNSRKKRLEELRFLMEKENIAYLGKTNGHLTGGLNTEREDPFVSARRRLTPNPEF